MGKAMHACLCMYALNRVLNVRLHRLPHVPVVWVAAEGHTVEGTEVTCWRGGVRQRRRNWGRPGAWRGRMRERRPGMGGLTLGRAGFGPKIAPPGLWVH